MRCAGGRAGGIPIALLCSIRRLDIWIAPPTDRASAAPMLKNVLPVALHHLRRRPFYTAIHVVGLATGMTCDAHRPAQACVASERLPVVKAIHLPYSLAP